MNNKMNEMMNTMMEQMMDKMMESMMTSMMASMTNAFANAMNPQVANAEVEQPKKVQGTNHMTREEYMQFVGNTAKEVKEPKVIDISQLDLVNIINYDEFGNGKPSMKVEFNMNSMPSEVWAINYLNLRDKYGAKYNHNGKYFTFKSKDNLTSCLVHYQVVKVLSVADYDRLIAYKNEQLKNYTEGSYNYNKIQKQINEWTEKKNAL